MDNSKILHMTLKKKWFDEILVGTKKTEYRDIKPYWTKRLFDKNGNVKNYDIIYFKNGYSKNCRKMKVEFLGIKNDILNGNKVYAIKLGKVLWQGK